MHAKSKHAFTLVELTVVIAIIGLLATLAMPAFQTMFAKADSIACTNNLRQIGMAVQGYAQDHEGSMPAIETDPKNPIYPADTDPQPLGLYDTLKDYGITEKTLQCPADLKAANYYAQKNSSYEWRPYIDEEQINNPQVYFRNTPRNVSSSRVRICQDFSGVHRGRMNALYADGHVTKPR